MNDLSEKQKRFADFYIETGNATESAVRAGYSKKTAKEIGCENLTKLNIKSYIDERLNQMKSERTADATEVLEFLTAVMRGEKKGTVLVGVGGGEQNVEQLPPGISERTKAAELLGKRYSLFTEKIELEGSLVQIVDNIPRSGKG